MFLRSVASLLVFLLLQFYAFVLFSYVVVKFCQYLNLFYYETFDMCKYTKNDFGDYMFEPQLNNYDTDAQSIQ
ncbi:hypothetical protein L1887_18276 [Cichorium endivia]|nr:hypothetical protein L1887_18276 [Cichorium endivia]